MKTLNQPRFPLHASLMENNMLPDGAGNLFSLAFELNPTPMAMLAPDECQFKVAMANPAFLKMLCSDKQSVLGNDFVSLFGQNGGLHADSLQTLKAALVKVQTEKTPLTLPITKYPAGMQGAVQSRYYQGKLIPSASSGELEYILAVVSDVTERYLGILELRKMKSRFDSSQKIARLGYWDYDIVNQKAFWSDGLRVILGLENYNTAPDFETFLNIIHPDDKDMYLQHHLDTLPGTRDVMDIEFRLLCRDGTLKFVHEISNRLKGPDGNVMSFEGVVKDITESKRLKEHLEESNLRYQYIGKATADTTYDWDIQGRKFFYIENYFKNFGYTDEETKQEKFWQRNTHPDDLKIVKFRNKQALEGSATSTLNEYRFRKKDGTYAYVIDRGFIVRNEEGKAVRIIGAIQDMSRINELQNLLHKTNRLAKIGTWEIDMKTGRFFWGEVTREIREADLGFEPVLEESLNHVIDEKVRRLIAKKLEESKTTGKPWQVEYQIETYKGNLKWIRTVCQPEIIGGVCQKLYGSFQDITEQKQAELKIRKLYTDKRLILESIDDAFFNVEKDWTISYWNPRAEEILGISKHKLIGKNLWGVFPENMIPAASRKYHEAMEMQRRTDFESYDQRLGKWFEVSAFPYQGGLSVFLRDITERKRAEVKIRESEEQYSTLFRLNPHPAWLFDARSLRFKQVNDAAITLYGYSEKELLNMTLREIVAPEDLPVMVSLLGDGADEERQITGRYRHRTKSGRIIYVMVRSKVILIGGKKYRMAVITDITEKFLVEQRVTRAIIQTQENERYEIGAELHDNVCQILASTYISMGVLGKSLDGDSTPLFKKCRDQIHLATQEIRNLSHRLAPASIGKATLKEAFATLLETSDPQDKYKVSFYYDEKLDAAGLGKELELMLYRVLQEQMRNILKYAACRTIEVGILRNKGKILMRIADDGIGFDLNNVRGGIGLANMRRRVEIFDGTIDIITSPGNGCEIVVQVPLTT